MIITQIPTIAFHRRHKRQRKLPPNSPSGLSPKRSNPNHKRLTGLSITLHGSCIRAIFIKQFAVFEEIMRREIYPLAGACDLDTAPRQRVTTAARNPMYSSCPVQKQALQTSKATYVTFLRKLSVNESLSRMSYSSAKICQLVTPFDRRIERGYGRSVLHYARPPSLDSSYAIPSKRQRISLHRV